MKNKTIATWLTFWTGPLGLHRFYLYGFTDTLGWLLPVPTALGFYGLERVQKLSKKGLLAPTVVIHTGTNGILTEDQLREMLDILSDRERVVIVNTNVPRPWMEPNNELIANCSALPMSRPVRRVEVRLPAFGTLSPVSSTFRTSPAARHRRRPAGRSGGSDARRGRALSGGAES